MKLSQFMEIKPEIRDAIRDNKPVVALESSIIAQGMPYPENIETAREVENIIREHGAIPATIAIIRGKLKVGLDEAELQYLGTNKEVLKASRRDLPVIITKKLSAATTVASTMVICSLAGIRIFATGGVGGVHRDVEETFDISADLQELAKTSVAVVSAGAKAILDIERTLEYLETMGVPVLGYKSHEFPAFYSRVSGFPVNYSMNSVSEIADVIATKWNLGLEGGVLIANPIPEEYAMEKQVVDSAIERTLEEASQEGIRGKELTPFMLSRISELTGGESLKSNIALIRNNAKLASKIAVEYAQKIVTLV